MELGKFSHYKKKALTYSLSIVSFAMLPILYVVWFAEHDAHGAVGGVIGLIGILITLIAIKKSENYFIYLRLLLLLGVSVLSVRIIQTGYSSSHAVFYFFSILGFSIFFGRKKDFIYVFLYTLVALIIIAIIEKIAQNAGYEVVNKGLYGTSLKFVIIIVNFVIVAVLFYLNEWANIKQQDLIKSQKSLIINKAKLFSLGEMAGGVAHEINNPMTIIDGNTQILMDQIKKGAISKEDLLKRLTKIKKTIHRVTLIISSLRKFSSQSEGNVYTQFDFKETIDEVLILMRKKAENENIEIINTIEKPFQVFGDPVLLGQVLIDLIGNALTANSDRNKSWIKISMNTSSGRYLVSIEDSGKIDKEISKKIFEPFFSTKGIGKGTGLGLSISYGVLQAHKGNIFLDLDSENTKFIIEIPIPKDISV